MLVLSILVCISFLKESSVLLKLLVLSFGVNHELHVTSFIFSIQHIYASTCRLWYIWSWRSPTWKLVFCFSCKLFGYPLANMKVIYQVCQKGFLLYLSKNQSATEWWASSVKYINLVKIITKQDPAELS